MQVQVYRGGLLTGDLVLGVLLAVTALAVGSAGLGNVDLKHCCQHCPANSSLLLFGYCLRADRCDTSGRIGVANDDHPTRMRGDSAPGEPG
jgi:hypothetical protein